MFISQKTLTEKASLNFSKINPAEFNKACNNLCFEIEQVIPAVEVKNFIVGEIIECEDVAETHLHKCVVNIGTKKLNIICGAPNARKGIKVVVALVGATTAEGLKIAPKEVRGFKSEGMLCGHNEIDKYFNDCLNKYDQEGIVELDKDAQIGDTNISKLLALDEVVYELTLPTNRNDQAGAYFVLSDFASYFKTKFDLKSVNNENKILVDYKLSLNNDISTFGGLMLLDNISHDLPTWKVKRDLLNNGIKIGCKTRTAVNEISYYTGVAPLFFEGSTCPKVIKQRFAHKNETITINSTEYVLDDTDVVLVDKDNNIIALDGIEVDDKYKVDPSNHSVMLYVSNLYFAYPRNTAIRLGISTNNTKYSKNTITKFQANLFLRDLNKVFKNVLVTDPFSDVEEPRVIKFNVDDCIKFIGVNLSQDQVINYLNQWHFKYDDNTKTVSVPGYRFDLENQWDLFEEVLKLYTIDDVVEVPVNAITNINNRRIDEYYFIDKLREMLNFCHILEAKTYNLTSKQELNNFNIYNYESRYEVKPCSNLARQFLRLSTINELLKVMSYNANHKVALQPIFELQKIYTDQVHFNLTILAPGKIEADTINDVTFNFNTFGLKGILKQFCYIFNCELKITRVDNEHLYPTDSLAIYYKDELIGFIGAIKHNLLKKYKLQNENLYVLTINIEKLIANYHSTEFKFEPISNIVPTFKDLTIDADITTNIQAISDEFTKLDFINQFKFIKAYRLNDSTIAYTIRFTLVNKSNTTLTKQEIDDDIKCIVNIIKKYNGTVKGM